MKVNIETQCLCSSNVRGIGYYTINLIEGLINRKRNEYTVSFFDYNRERNNKGYIEKHLKNSIAKGLQIRECNSLSYQAILRGNEEDNAQLYEQYAYEEYMGDNFDICHIPSVHNVPRNINAKTIVTVHDILPLISEFQIAWQDKIRAQFINSLDFVKRENIEIIAVSEATKRDLIERVGIDSKRIHVILEAYAPSIYYVDKKKSILEEMKIISPYILYLGALDSRKGILNILDAFEIVKEKNKDIKLVLAGGLDYSGIQISKRLNDYKYIEDVILPGFVSEEQKRVLMSCAEVFLFPSDYEGFGLPVLEAMACGAPVITTNVSSLPEVGGDAVMYVMPGQSEELAVAIEKMLSSEKIRQYHIAKGFEQCKKFSWDKTAEMTENVYRMVGKNEGRY